MTALVKIVPRAPCCDFEQQFKLTLLQASNMAAGEDYLLLIHQKTDTSEY